MVFHVVFIDMFAQQQIAKAKPFFSLLHRSTTNPHHSVFSTYRRHQLHGRRFFKRSARCRRQQREALLRSGQIKKPASIAHTALWAVPALAGPPPAASAIAGHSNKDIAAVKAAFSFSKFAPGERHGSVAAAYCTRLLLSTASSGCSRWLGYSFFPYLVPAIFQKTSL